MQKNFTVEIILLMLFVGLITSCNAVIGMPFDSEGQLWQSFFMSFCSILQVQHVASLGLLISL
jgi:hypothetical protein